MNKSILIFAVIVMNSFICQTVYCEGQSPDIIALETDGENKDFLSSLKLRERVGALGHDIYMEEKALVFEKELQDRGYVIFMRNYLEKVYPLSYPKKEEIKNEINIYSAQGEYEPAVFAVYALRQLNNVRVKIGDLTGPDKKTISKNNIDIKVVRYVAQAGNKRSYSVEPGVLTSRESTVVPEKTCKQFWLTVKVSQDALPGDYQGQIEFSAEGLPVSVITLKLKVLPIKLQIPQDVTYAHLYYDIPKNEKLQKKLLAVLKEHGMNSISLTGILPGYEALIDTDKIDFNIADSFMKVYKEAGMAGPVVLVDTIIQGGPSYGGIEKYKKLDTEESLAKLKHGFKMVIEHAKEQGWPPVLFYGSAELSNDGKVGVEFGKKLMKAMKEVKGVNIAVSINRPEGLEIIPWVDVVMYNKGVINEETINRTKKIGKPFWFTSIGVNRFTEGVYLWRTGAAGRRQYKLNGSMQKIDDMLTLIYPVDEEFLCHIKMEWGREGSEDYRYIYTLESLIKKAKDKKEKTVLSAVSRAEILLGELKNETEVDFPLESAVDNSGWADHPGFSDINRYEYFRWNIAQSIIELQAVSR